MKMKSLYNICISYLGKHLDLLGPTEELPQEVKEWMVDWLSSHDLLASSQVTSLLANHGFSRNLKRLTFYLSGDLTDEVLISLGLCNTQLREVTIIHCENVTDDGILGITTRQEHLCQLELRGLPHLTSQGLAGIFAPTLSSVDLSDCNGVCSSGVSQVITRNPWIRRLFLNRCTGVDDAAIFAIGLHLCNTLETLELDFLQNLLDPAAAITFLTRRCTRLSRLSLCKYFESDLDMLSDILNVECTISCDKLRELDLYGNFFTIFPHLPINISTIRLSCTGTENVEDLLYRILHMPKLEVLRLCMNCKEATETAVNSVNEFMTNFIPACGDKITTLQIEAYQLFDDTLDKIIEYCPRLATFSLDVVHVSSDLLFALFTYEDPLPHRLRSLKLHGLTLPYRVIFAAAKHGGQLEEIEMSHMTCVDNRFLKFLAANCPNLRSANFNGCRWVTDKGLCILARACPLKEVRVRATSVTDKCLYVLAQFCPNLEWIAHADYTGKPKFSEDALQTLKDSCVQKVIC